ncbi:Ankyrin-1 [Phytophthora citrophthora]|uniref:Ankyrin-1 n=1 Tax=Phytophthora citrophthora TaxID=4793 RepID=A0AAD9G5J8_9STRA|nr:Ankyrin-1 [Phytophthora citrophthora]
MLLMDCLALAAWLDALGGNVAMCKGAPSTPPTVWHIFDPCQRLIDHVLALQDQLVYCPLADFGAIGVREGQDIYAQAVVAQPVTAHVPLKNACELKGKIAMLQRGICDFVSKILHAQQAGAVAVLMANNSEEGGGEAFVMDAGQRHDQLADTVTIPALMVSRVCATEIFQHIREAYLDRRELCLTIRFLGAQTASRVLAQQETLAQQSRNAERDLELKQQREQQQQEAASLLRDRLGKAVASKGSVGSAVATPSTSASELAFDWSPASSVKSICTSSREGRGYNQKELEIVEGAHAATLAMLHWCPMTTALVILDVQNFFTRRHGYGAEAFDTHSNSKSPIKAVDTKFYEDVDNVLVPTIQDVLLASRATEGMEVIYSVVESATRDGRERSRVHKHAGIHVPKNGFGAQVPKRIAPDDGNDIVLPRTGVNVFAATNLDYVLRNLMVTHIVVMGISVLGSAESCVQTALDRGYQVSVVKEALLPLTEGDSKKISMLESFSSRGVQVITAAEFLPTINQGELIIILLTKVLLNLPHETTAIRASGMTELSEVNTVLASLVDAVVASNQESIEVLPIGGFLWKFPSEGSNTSSILPPPAPEVCEYPRKCLQCGVCWVSDRDFELDHSRRCYEALEDIPTPTNLGVPRRVWCEVDESFSRLQWRHDREPSSEDNGSCAVNFVAFTDIREVLVLEEPSNCFQIRTFGHRTIAFQWRQEKDEEAANDLAPYRLELDACQWQEYLDELSKYARDSPSDGAISGEKNWSTADIFNEASRLLTSERSAHSLPSLLEKAGYGSDLRDLHDEEGNSLVHLAVRLNLSAIVIFRLLDMGVDCNHQNNEGESPLLLVAASGDIATARILLSLPAIQVDMPCSLGATAFHAAANAGDVKMLQLLCDAGAQPDTRDDNGWTALHYAAACSTGLEAVHFLCELLTDELIDAQCSEGNTALHVAAGCGYQENVRALLETAASPHLSNFSEESAYHLALRNSHIQCAVAINDYQSMPPTIYTEPQPMKTSAVSTASAVARKESDATGEWLEAFTEDGYTYYYNSVTGETSWYKPGEHQLPGTQGEPDPGIYDDKTSDVDVSHSFDADSILGDQLPLCLIPMVSPLTSLDNPTAAAKYEALRRKARKQRKRRHSKGNFNVNHENEVTQASAV